MDAIWLIEKLNSLGFTPENYLDQIYDSGSYDAGTKTISNDDIRAVVGPWTELEKEKEVLIKDEWGDAESVKRTLLYFVDHHIYLAAHQFSGSYGREEWTEWYQVVARTETIYVKLEEEDDSSYKY